MVGCKNEAFRPRFLWLRFDARGAAVVAAQGDFFAGELAFHERGGAREGDVVHVALFLHERLCAFLGGFDGLKLELLHALGVVGEDYDLVVGAHLQEAGGEREERLVGADPHLRFSWAQCAHERGVAGQDRDFAVSGHRGDRIDDGLVGHPFGRDDLEGQGHRSRYEPTNWLRNYEISFVRSFAAVGWFVTSCGYILDSSLKVKRLLGLVVVLPFQDLLERAHGVGTLHERALDAGELLGHVERLRQELLDLTRAGHGELVVLGQLVHAKDGDDVLEVLVTLQHFLHAAGNVVVLLAHHVGRKDRRARVERIDGRVDAELGQAAGKNHGRIEVTEGGGRCRIGKVVGRDVHGLNGRDGAFLGGGGAFLERAHFAGEVRLVTHGRRDASEQRGHFGTGPGETEDVVHA